MRFMFMAATVAVAALSANADAAFNPAVIGPIVNHWQFDEPNDTPLTGAGDSVGTSAWIYDLGFNPTTEVQTSTIQDGAFEVKRPGAGHYINSYAPVDLAGVASGKIYLIGDVTWDYTDSTSPADFRMGFHNATAGENTTSPTTGTPPVTILAEIVLRRNTATEIQLGAWGTDEDGVTDINPTETAPWTTIGGAVQSDPVRLVLELDTVDRWGAVHWSTDGGATFSTIGGDGHTFDLNATWDPNFVRLGALNNFVSGTGTGLQLHSLAVAIPEPSSLLLCLLAAMGLLVGRRR